MTDPLEHALFGESAGDDFPRRRDLKRADLKRRAVKNDRGYRREPNGEEGPRRQGKRGDTKHEAPRRRGRSVRRFVILTLVLLLVGGAGLAAVTVLRPLVSKIPGFGGLSDTDYPGPGEGQVQITVAKGQTGEEIATTLRDNGVTKTRTAYLQAAAADPAAAALIRPGTYSMKKQMSGADAFKVLINPANALGGVTLPEGLWKSETFARLSQATGIPVADYEAAAKDPAAIGLPEVASGNVEGWLSPMTYEFPDKATATQQLAIMVKRTADELTKLGVPADQQQRVLTLASIIEGEVNAHTDRGKVARVLENRLDNVTGPTAGFLQMDSTRNYALQKRGNLSAADAQAAKASPYDTYTHKGLPPGPINNPSFASIGAAAKPTPGNWYYFVTVNFDTGETLFAETLAEQERNRAQLTAYCKANPDKCAAK